jgi:HAD superfamily hydrolase (TIGR01493 family)
MNYTNIKAVAFDAFGTLVEIADKRRPFARLADRAKQKVSRSPMTERMNLAQMASLIGVTLSDAEFDTLASDLNHELAHTRTYPEVEHVLRTLRDRGLQTAVASNLAEPYAVPIIEQLGELLDITCFSFEVGAVKPAARFYELLSAQMGFAPSEILMIGDTWRCDYEGASAAGFKALHLDRRGNANEQQRSVSIRTLADIL